MTHGTTAAGQMNKACHEFRKAWRIIIRRMRDDGLWTTLVWGYARLLPKITGIPLLEYSKITDAVYVGPQHRKAGLAHMAAAGINAVVNMRVEHDDAQHGCAPVAYCYLPTVDDAAPSLEHLRAGVAFMQRVIGDGGKVYIHCKGGIGRAPSMAIAYFVAEGQSLADAIALVKRTRPFVNITSVQMEQLRRFEADQAVHKEQA